MPSPEPAWNGGKAGKGGGKTLKTTLRQHEDKIIVLETVANIDVTKDRRVQSVIENKSGP